MVVFIMDVDIDTGIVRSYNVYEVKRFASGGGMTMATMKDIAKETGLGLATISKHINGGNVREKNKIAIDRAIEKLGFTANAFARGLKTGRSHTIGVIIPELGNLFVTNIITAMADILREKGYAIIVCDCRTDKRLEGDMVKFLLEKKVDGIVNMPVSKNGEHLRPAIANHVPVILLDRMINELKEDVSAVLVDNVNASASAVKLLIDAGHYEIGIILGPQDIFTSQQRLLGYNQVFIQNSIPPNDSYVIFSDYSVQGGYESMKSLLEENKVTAVFTTNYEMTLGAIIALNERGIQIPEQISFVGFDNMQISQVVQPKLTVISQPLKEIGEHAAILLLELLGNENNGNTKNITLSTEIIVGKSILARR